MTLEALAKIDRQHKGEGFDEEVRTLLNYYDDTSRSQTVSRLQDFGQGIKDNPFPIELALIRRVIDRIAVVYQNPPTRWLRNILGQRVDENSLEHRNMIRALDTAQYDLAWRRVDRLRALLRQCVIRYYPSRAHGGVVLRIFTPDNVMRHPSSVAPDMIEEDNAIALKLEADWQGNGTLWEYWEQDDEGVWSCQWINKDGEPVGEQPFGDGPCPYDELPIQLVYEDWAGGRPWLYPRCSRRGWIESLNASVNDLPAIVRSQTHDKTIYKTANPENTIPADYGPGTVTQIDAADDVEILSHNPQIRSCIDSIEFLIRYWMISEDLPSTEFDRSKQMVTGAALKVQERPLIARQEAQIPMAKHDERLAWRKFRAVHNYHADNWGRLQLDQDYEMDVEIADLVIPYDTRDVQETGVRGMALSTHSVIDVIQMVYNMPRNRAIEVYERVKADQEAYPITLVDDRSIDQGDENENNALEVPPDLNVN